MDLFNLLIIFVLGFAFHCPAMCGPVVSVLYPDFAMAKRFHLGRLLGYSALGAIAGQIGAFVYSLGFMMLGMLGLAGLIVLFTVKSKISFIPTNHLKRLVPHPLLLGLMFSFIPCHYLWTMVGIAALSGSMITGTVVMGAHAVMSAIGIQALQKIPLYQRLKQRVSGFEKWLFAASVLLLVIRMSMGTAPQTNGAIPPLICW